MRNIFLLITTIFLQGCSVFEARLQLSRRQLDKATVGRLLLKKPIMTAFKVVGIYYQALKIYLKGIPFIPYNKEAV